MNMIRCDLCPNLIDSDADPACFVEGNPSGCFCKACRDQAAKEVAQQSSKPVQMCGCGAVLESPAKYAEHCRDFPAHFVSTGGGA